MAVQQISITLLFVFLIPLQLRFLTAQETPIPQSQVRCDASNTPPSNRFRYYLSNTAVPALLLGTQSKHFEYFSRVPGFTPIAYTAYLCRGDINATRCFDCVSLASATALRNCSTTCLEAVVWGDVCTFRYSDKPFNGRKDESPELVLANDTVSVPASVNLTRYNEAVTQATDVIVNSKEIRPSTPYGVKFRTEAVNVSGESSSSETIYAMGECMWDLTPDDCRLCLHGCAQKLISVEGKVGGRVLFPSCNFRYELYRFYHEGQGQQDGLDPVGNHHRSDPRQPKTNATHSNHTRTPRGIVGDPLGGGKMDPHGWKRPSHVVDELASFGATLAVLVLVIFGAIFCANRRKKTMQASIEMEEITSADSLRFDLSKIRAATLNFAADKKLGQGGFGQVYKGKLANGQDIAVKRLSRDSSQGIAEFKTEILLVANLQHRNLVKLLGFSFSGKEKILVYEYLSNSSLDRILFDPRKRESLNWETRFKIISGIAKGLLYLHEDSRLKIIHRDLKTSNILLDDFMNPKISDFGMAKLFGVDQTRDATNTIVGTYGYMAPEYMLTGQYSVKSDIYSFGIIVLEMVTGLRNRYMSRPLLEEALLHRAWRLWNEGSGLELVDYVLGDVYSREEVIKCIHIALLCIQEDASRRPNMTWVVAAIRDETNHFPAPTSPNFFNSIRRSASGSCSSTDPGAGSSTARETLTDLHPR